MNIIHLESNNEDVTKLIIKGENTEILALFTLLSGELIKSNITSADKLKEYIDYSQNTPEELIEIIKKRLESLIDSL